MSPHFFYPILDYGFFQWIWILVILTAVVSGAVMAYLTRGITFYNTGTDNEKIVKAAAHLEEWGHHLSGMHKYADGKAYMKEVSVLGLAVVQRMINDKTSDYSLVLLCLIANTLGVIVLFFVAETYWGPVVALITFSLLVFSFWSSQVAMWGGVVCVSQTFFLLTVRFAQLAETPSAQIRLGWCFAAGLSLGLMLFASASSRKYLPLTFASFIWSVRDLITWPLFGSDVLSSFRLTSWLVSGIVLTLIVAAVFVYSVRHWFLTQEKMDRYPVGVRVKLMGSQPDLFSHRFHKITRLLRLFERYALTAAGSLLVLLIFSSEYMFWLAWMSGFVGFCIVVAVFTYPNIVGNLAGYYSYMQYGKPTWRSRFYAYREFFAHSGHPIPENMRGAGVNWLFRYFFLIAPFHLICLFICGLILSLLILNQKSIEAAALSICAILIGLSPVIVGELTQGVQLGRSYYPGLIGLLFFIGYAVSFISRALLPNELTLFWTGLLALLMTCLVWNVWILWTDVLPSRMSSVNLMKTLRKLGARKFYTYDTIYNDSFVKTLPANFTQNIVIEWMDHLDQVKDGYIVIPGTSNKSVMLVDYPIARQPDSGFEQDLILKELVESRRINQYALESFKTLASSPIWVHEDEVASYRDLILQEITEMDRWRGKAWLLDGRKLYSDLQKRKTESV